MNMQRSLCLTLAVQRFLWTASIAILLTGCGVTLSGVTLSDVRGKLAESIPCCNGYREIQYTQIDVESPLLVSISSKHQVFIFESGKSPFLAFELPLVKEPLRLTVESYMQASLQSPTTGDQYFFAPNVILLDAEYKILRSQEPRTRRVVYVPVTEFFGTGGLGWKIVLSTDIEAEERVRFVIIRTTERLLSDETKIPAPRTASGERGIPHAPTGRVRVGLKPVSQLLESVLIERKPAYTTIMGIPAGKTKAITDTLPSIERANVAVNAWPEFRPDTRKILGGVILHNDYPDVALYAGLIEFLESYPGAVIGITWNGGIATTARDFAWAEQQLELFRSDPARYDRERQKDRSKDRLHPLNHFEPLLDLQFD